MCLNTVTSINFVNYFTDQGRHRPALKYSSWPWERCAAECADIRVDRGQWHARWSGHGARTWVCYWSLLGDTDQQGYSACVGSGTSIVPHSHCPYHLASSSDPPQLQTYNNGYSLITCYWHNGNEQSPTETLVCMITVGGKHCLIT